MTTLDPGETIPADAPGGTDAAQSDEADTEGHSMLSYELGRELAREHAAEADRIARDSARARAARKPRSFLSRLRGRS